MLSPPTMEKLHALKLAAMAAAWTAQQQDAPASALSLNTARRISPSSATSQVTAGVCR